MKKTYMRPEIMFESFTLSTNIAGDCEVKTDTPSKGNCGLEAPGLGTVFLEGMTGCSWQVGEQAHDGICYHTFEGNSLFNS